MSSISAPEPEGSPSDFRRLDTSWSAPLKSMRMQHRVTLQISTRVVNQKLLSLCAQPRDLTEQSPDLVAREFGLSSVANSVDVVLAGLPCQAFARIGRSKLGALAEDPAAYRKDPRAKLYRRMLVFVRAVKPLCVVLENVPDILNYGGHNVLEEICGELEAWGYQCGYTLLNAAYYGVPQMRERLFLVALHESIGAKPMFPPPTHWVRMPAGYAGVRQFALKHVDRAASHYMDPPQPGKSLRPAVTARQAMEVTWILKKVLEAVIGSAWAQYGRKKSVRERTADQLRLYYAELGGLRDRGDGGRTRGAAYAARLCAVRSDEARRAVSGDSTGALSRVSRRRQAGGGVMATTCMKVRRHGCL